MSYRGASSHEEKAELSFDGVDLSREYGVKSHEEILCLQEASPKCIVYATQTTIKLMATLDREDKVYKSVNFDHPATHVSVLDDLVICTHKNGCIEFLRLQTPPAPEELEDMIG